MAARFAISALRRAQVLANPLQRTSLRIATSHTVMKSSVLPNLLPASGVSIGSALSSSSGFHTSVALASASTETDTTIVTDEGDKDRIDEDREGVEDDPDDDLPVDENDPDKDTSMETLMQNAQKEVTQEVQAEANEEAVATKKRAPYNGWIELPDLVHVTFMNTPAEQSAKEMSAEMVDNQLQKYVRWIRCLRRTVKKTKRKTKKKKARRRLLRMRVREREKLWEIKYYQNKKEGDVAWQHKPLKAFNPVKRENF